MNMKQTAAKVATEKVEMVSAAEARKITERASFQNSPFVALINSSIRDAASNGKSEANILVPMAVADDAAKFLEQHGFKVSGGVTMTGVVITVHW